MQVSHVNNHATHVVIGGKQAIEFGISNSAEFFNILSSTLYKDQILAVVREVLCNAWDAHIEAGIISKPVEITLSSTYFIIKDFGTGIHADDMGTIYGTYGNSTKKNDGKQTGGFGLGCKAPFAYTDHFEVTSCHDGVKTIYNLSKSSAEAMGKPGITPIASFPTTETGLQVKIGIKPQDHPRFCQLITRIVKNGDMNMLVNNEVRETLGFDASKSNYMITSEALLDSNTAIMVRYGNVIYPVDMASEIGKEYKTIILHLRKLVGYRIVFQAPAHSIAVTPSRESLSMQEHTIKTLKELFDGFISMIDKDFSPYCHKYAEVSVQKAVADKEIKNLLHRRASLPCAIESEAPVQIFDLDTMARCYMHGNYPDTVSFRKKDIKFRLESMMASKLLDRGLVQTYLRELETVNNLPHYWSQIIVSTFWFQRKVVAPLVSKLIKAKLDHKKLFICDSEGKGVVTNHTGNLAPLAPANQYRPTHLFNALPLLRNIVVVTGAKANLTERAYRHEVFKRLGNYYGFFVYHVSMKKAEREAALEFFNNSGMKVVDLTVRQDWEEPYVKPVNTAPKKPVQKGLVCLSNVLVSTYISTYMSRREDAVRIENPEFVVYLPMSKGTSTDCFDRWNSIASKYIVELFGSKGGVTTMTSTHDKWKLKGAKEMNTYVWEKVSEYVSTSKTIQEYWAYAPKRSMEAIGLNEYGNAELVSFIYNNPTLRTTFKLVNNLTDEDKKYLYLWDKIIERIIVLPDFVRKAYDQLNTIPVAQENKDLLTKFVNNPLLEMINCRSMGRLLKDKDINAPEVKKAIAILTTILNN